MPTREQSEFFEYRNPLADRLGRSFFKNVPVLPGVYFMKNLSGYILYIGKAKNLRARLNSYKNAKPSAVSRKVLRLLRLTQNIEWQLCESEQHALLTENNLLRELRPPFNVVNTQPETYYFITLKAVAMAADSTNIMMHFELTTNPGGPNRDEADARYGVFKGRGLTRRAFGALLRLLSALSANDEGFYFPTALTRYRMPYRYSIGLKQELLEPLRRFLAGSSRAFLEQMIERLLSNELIPRFIHHVINEDLKVLADFFEYGPKRVYQLKRNHGIKRRVIAQDEIDDLLVLRLAYKL